MKTVDASTAGEPIPNLVAGIAENLPLKTGSAGFVNLESAPISRAAADEIARVAGKGALIRLTNPADYAATAHQAVLKALGNRVGSVMQQTIDGITTTVIRLK